MESDEWNWIHMGLMEGVSCVIRPCFDIFLCDQLLLSEHDLEYDLLSTFVCVFTSMSEFLVVDRVYRSHDFSLGRMSSLIRFAHLCKGRFDVVWDSWRILVILHAQPCLWEHIEELPWIVTVIR